MYATNNHGAIVTNESWSKIEIIAIIITINKDDGNQQRDKNISITIFYFENNLNTTLKSQQRCDLSCSIDLKNQNAKSDN